MARAGVYKWDVKAARDRLRAQRRHPSVDAVRTALGDTGSKSTIHRYLKELEAEEAGTAASGVAVSEALTALVSQLAERLQQEGQDVILAATQRFAMDRNTLEDALADARREAANLRTQLEQSQLASSQTQHALAAANTQLQTEQVRCAQLVEQASATELRLLEQEAHRQSLEEKHRHAREALDHFRNSVKEQRAQEQRRHEQQVQQLQAELRIANASLGEKLSQLNQINREAAALTAEVSGLRGQLNDLRSDRDRIERDLGKAHGQVIQLQGARDGVIEKLHAATDIQVRQQQELASRDERIRDLELAAAKFEGQLEMAKEASARLEAEATRLRDELADLPQKEKAVPAPTHRAR